MWYNKFSTSKGEKKKEIVMRNRATSIALLAGVLSILMFGVGNAEPVHHVLTVSKTGSGTITSSPSGINCGSDCSESYEDGTEVTLTATADDGWGIGNWFDDVMDRDTILCQLF